jgi:predicted enzyme related to lactoylglutathione lyase
MLNIAVTSVYVDDQAKALSFYTDVLGFEKKTDIPLGEARWLTVVSPAAPDGVELLLEPDDSPIAKAYKQGLTEAGMPVMVFGTDDIQVEYARMTERGVVFTTPPTAMGGVTQAVFDDTCGNLLMLIQTD